MSCPSSSLTRRLLVESLEPRRMLYGVLESPYLAPAEGETAPMADFQLPDVNPTSPRFGTQVSPRDYLDQVTGWYFGSAL